MSPNKNIFCFKRKFEPSSTKIIDMCVCDRNITDHETVQLVKDFTTEHAVGAVEFYLNTNEEWDYENLIEI